MTFGPSTTALIDRGTGSDAIVFLHGWCCRNGDFTAVINSLADHHRVIAIDWQDRMRRLGLDGSCEAISEDVGQLLGELEAGNPLVCGHSISAGIALMLESRSLVTSRGLLLLDSGMVLSDASQQALGQWSNQMATMSASDFFRKTASPYFFLDSECGTESERLLHQVSERPTREACLLLDQFSSVEWVEVMQQVQVPVHYVASSLNHSDLGALLPPRLPHCTFERLACGHFIQVFAPDELVRMIEDEGLWKSRSADP